MIENIQNLAIASLTGCVIALAILAVVAALKLHWDTKKRD